jgi:putative oxidoreductase
MTMQSSHPSLSRADNMAANCTSGILLVGRILLGYLFLAAGYYKFMGIAGTTAYFANLKVPAPELVSWLTACLEVILGAALILGIATRYAALVTFIFVLVATVIAHRWWEYTGPANGAQWNNFLKNLAIMGGALAIFVTGAGRYSIDDKLRG